jgi:hypothetical protein
MIPLRRREYCYDFGLAHEEEAKAGGSVFGRQKLRTEDQKAQQVNAELLRGVFHFFQKLLSAPF